MKNTLIATTTALSLFAYAAPADALSCVPCEGVLAPRVVERLPSNFELRIAQLGAEQLPTLSGPGDPTLTCSPIAGLHNELVACTSTATLTVGAAYTIEGDYRHGARTLTIEAAPDTSPPGAPTIVSLFERRRSEQPEIAAGPQTGVDIVVSSTESVASLSLEVGVTPEGSQDERIVALEGYSLDDDLGGFVGSTFCQCGGALDADLFDGEVAVRARFVDAAGNRGAWSVAQTPLPDPEAGGCTCVATRGPGSLLLGGVFLLALLRRRRDP